MMMMMMMTKR